MPSYASQSQTPDSPGDLWDELQAEEVVVDVTSPYVYLGTLVGQISGYLILEWADAHDLRDTSTSRERYVVDARLHGIQRNRRKVWVNLNEVVSISRLADVIGHE